MATRSYSAFVAYPGSPADLARPITTAADRASHGGTVRVKAWPRMDIFGAQIPDEIRGEIEQADIIFADITRSNLNVYYEIGYAIGLGKTFLPIINSSFANAASSLAGIGLFNNIGYKAYENSDQLTEIFSSTPTSSLLELYAKEINFSQPIFVVDTLRKTNFRNALISAVKQSRSHYRSFDPVENPRISVVQLIAEITASSGVVIPYLASHVDDSERHNLRSAFVAGLSMGLGRGTLILTDQEDERSPTDYNENIIVARDQNAISDSVQAFCEEALVSAQEIPAIVLKSNRTAIQKLSLGASAAENEFRDLQRYFVDTSEYLRAARGEVNVVTGRKGSGKSAIFFRVRDNARRRKDSLIVDLKPESHRLSAFRDEILSTVGAGVFEHTIAAFWYFVCISEMLLSIYKRFESSSRFDGRALGPMREIEDIFAEYQILEPGDFTTRLSRLSNIIARELKEATRAGKSMSANQVTNMVFRTGIAKIRDKIVQLTSSQHPLIFLFDNIDKGWPADGVTDGDVTIVRLLIENLDKVKNDFAARDREFQSIVFLRHDVYDLMMNQTSDRGKSGQVSIDWTDRAKLAQVLYRRLQIGLSDRQSSMPDLWSKVFPDVVEGIPSFDYLADHCLMRPRFLIDLAEASIANAINRGHSTVQSADCVDAVKQYSASLVDDFGFEMRDVSGIDNALLYSLIGCEQSAPRTYFEMQFRDWGLDQESSGRAIDLMLWYGLLGVSDADGRGRYIYDFGYNMRRLSAEAAKSQSGMLIVNPGLYVGLR